MAGGLVFDEIEENFPNPGAYDQMMKLTDRHSFPNQAELRKIYSFANSWFSRAAWRSFPIVHQRISESWSSLEVLVGLRLEDGAIGALVESASERLAVQRLLHFAFDAISTPWKVGPTAASKILHGMFPDLAVMWDTSIREKLAGGQTGYHYSYIFMPLMLKEINEALLSCMKERQVDKESALARIKQARGRDYSLAKMIDEYNWVTIRRGRRLVPYSGQ